MMGGDTLKATRKATAKFNDARVRQFYDPGKAAGRAFARSLGRDGNIAWDFYFFYPIQSEWADLPPRPEVYMHQLSNGWADQSRLFEKRKLTKKLKETMQSLFP